MATYLEGVEDGRRDTLVRIEREAIAVMRDSLTDQTLHRYPDQIKAAKVKVETMVGLIKSLSPEPQSWTALYEAIQSKALRQIEAERTEAKLAGAQVVS